MTQQSPAYFSVATWTDAAFKMHALIIHITDCKVICLIACKMEKLEQHPLKETARFARLEQRWVYWVCSLLLIIF